MRKYKVIFFDWDGTAVISRKAPADSAAQAMSPLLASGIKLAIISGTSIGNIDGGKLAQRFPPEHRANLYFGLDRGANNYAFDGEGGIFRFGGAQPSLEDIVELHRACFDFHTELLERFALNTDITFCRDNYCKVDIGAGISRGDRLFFTGAELEQVNATLKAHGCEGGVRALLALAEQHGRDRGLALQATTDAKFIELGFTTKSDNVNAILTRLEGCGIEPSDCCFWGDEYLAMDEGIFGSDSYMITSRTENSDFFDVSDVPGVRLRQVQRLGGGVERFIGFLGEQAGRG